MLLRHLTNCTTAGVRTNRSWNLNWCHKLLPRETMVKVVRGSTYCQGWCVLQACSTEHMSHHYPCGTLPVLAYWRHLSRGHCRLAVYLAFAVPLTYTHCSHQCYIIYISHLLSPCPDSYAMYPVCLGNPHHPHNTAGHNWADHIQRKLSYTTMSLVHNPMNHKSNHSVVTIATKSQSEILRAIHCTGNHSTTLLYLHTDMSVLLDGWKFCLHTLASWMNSFMQTRMSLF